MNIVLWIVQWLLSMLFLGAGAQKLFGYERIKQKAVAESPPRDLGIPRELAAFIGISEVAGAIGLILPGSAGIAPVPPDSSSSVSIIIPFASYHAGACN